MPAITMKHENGLAFSTEINGHTFHIDADEENGGNNMGPRPKPLLLAALSGCTGIDVVSILKKMKVEYDSFQVHVEANMTETHPKYYDKFHLIYEFSGKDLPLKKIEKAIKLSQDNYCGVSAMFSKSSTLSYEIRITEK
jgi:putative redox protein